jgi:hypothetical protein
MSKFNIHILYVETTYFSSIYIIYMSYKLLHEIRVSLQRFCLKIDPQWTHPSVKQPLFPPLLHY